MAINKVIYGNDTLVDLTGDSVTPATLLQGETAHDRSGRVITGSMLPTAGVTSFNGRNGSVIPMSGDYNDSQVVLSSVMHISGETQTNVKEALDALDDKSEAASQSEINAIKSAFSVNSGTAIIPQPMTSDEVQSVKDAFVIN